MRRSLSLSPPPSSSSAAMRTEHALMVEEMQSWDKDPIWLAYEEEANKVVWDINQKCVCALQ